MRDLIPLLRKHPTLYHKAVQQAVPKVMFDYLAINPVGVSRRAHAALFPPQVPTVTEVIHVWRFFIDLYPLSVMQQQLPVCSLTKRYCCEA
jgi:hypothetical protein